MELRYLYKAKPSLLSGLNDGIKEGWIAPWARLRLQFKVPQILKHFISGRQKTVKVQYVQHMHKTAAQVGNRSVLS